MSFRIDTKIIDGVEYVTGCITAGNTPPDHEYIVRKPIEASLRDETTGRLLYRVMHNEPPYSSENPRLVFVKQLQVESEEQKTSREERELERAISERVSHKEVVEALIALAANDPAPAAAIRDKLLDLKTISGVQ